MTAKIFKLTLIFVSIAILAACNPLEDDSDSASLLIIEEILGTTAEGTEALFLQSDVQFIDQQTMATSVRSDLAKVTLRASLLDPASITGPSQYNNITLTGYNVTYTLPDGTGVAGTDVPMPIENSLSTVMIEVGKSTTLSVPVVLDTAKLLAPLAALAGTSNVLQVIAVIEFTGEDMIKKPVTAVGNLTIYFADYIDSGT